MPRYHFNVRNGVRISDEAGTELGGINDARLVAVQFAGEILRDEAEAFWTTREWHLDVTNDEGGRLFSLDLSVSEDAPTSAAQHDRESPDLRRR